jgi:hypothetical protein
LLLPYSIKIVIVLQEQFFSLATLIQSERVRKALTLAHGPFKRLFGVKKGTFNKMLEILHDAYTELHKLGGKPTTKLHVEDKLLLTLQYHREYRTMEHIGFDYDVVKSAVHSAIVWVEDVLIREGTFRLPGKKSLIAGEQTPKTVLVDVKEHPIERPQRNRELTTPASKRNIPSSRRCLSMPRRK